MANKISVLFAALIFLSNNNFTDAVCILCVLGKCLDANSSTIIISEYNKETARSALLLLANLSNSGNFDDAASIVPSKLQWQLAQRIVALFLKHFFALRW